MSRRYYRSQLTSRTVAVRAQGKSWEEVRGLTIRQNEKLYLQVVPNPARIWTGLAGSLIGLGGIPSALLAQDFLEDAMEVKMFLFQESSEEEFTFVMENFFERPIEYVPPGNFYSCLNPACANWPPADRSHRAVVLFSNTTDSTFATAKRIWRETA